MAKTILLADDSVTIQKVVELTFMEQNDFGVEAVSDGDSALARLAELQPDLVIADVNMPGADGYEVCRRSKSQFPHIPVLLLVGTFEPFDEAQARAAGADGFLKKPFDSQDLLRQVEGLTSGSGTPAEAPPMPQIDDLATIQASDSVLAQAARVTPPAPLAPAAEPATFAAPPPATFAAPPPATFAASPATDFAAPPTDFAPPAESQPMADEAALTFDAPSVDMPPVDMPPVDVPSVEPPAPEVPVFEPMAAPVAATPEPIPAAPEPVPVAMTPEPIPVAPEPVPVAPEPVPAVVTPEPPAVAPPVAAAPAPSNGAGILDDETIERIARRVAEIVGEKAAREVAWEVIPDLAEVIIKDRIRELENQVDG